MLPMLKQIPYPDFSQTRFMPPELLQKIKAPLRMVRIAAMFIASGKLFVRASCCINFPPSGPNFFADGMINNTIMKLAPAHTIPKNM